MRIPLAAALVLSLVHCAHRAPAPAAVSAVASAPAPEALRGRVVSVLRHAGHRWAVLSPEVEGVEASGPATLVQRIDTVIVARAVRPETLPVAMRRVQGAGLMLAASDGARCRVTLGAPVLLARVHPHFETLNRWEGRDEEGAQTMPRVDDATVAAETWSDYSDGRLLVAPLAGEGCDAATWGHAVDQPVTVFAGAPALPALRDRALAAHRATTVWRDLQRVMTESTPAEERPAPGTRWDELSERPRVTVWRAEGTRRVFVTVHSRHAGEGCGSFGGAVWTAWEQVGDALVARSADTLDATSLDFEPVEAVDADGDGTPDFLSADRVVAFGPEGYAERLGLRVAEHDCPC